MNILKIKNFFYLLITLLTVGVLVTSCQKESILTETEITKDVIDLKVDDTALQNTLEDNDEILSSRAVSKCVYEEWRALRTIYQTNNGANWRNKTNWSMVNTTTPPANCDLGQLYGVTLHPTGRVKSLSLANNRLTGTLKQNIRSLKELVSLNLSRNNFTGVVQKDLGELKYLEYLNLSNNNFSGSLDDEIGNIGSLANTYYINLANNDLSGCYDENLENLCDVIIKSISSGNNFDASFTDFCNSGAGVCP